MAAKNNFIHIDFRSSFEMVDLVHSVFESIADQIGFDADSSHWMSVAIRESVTNAVRHGNKMDPAKRVTVRFEFDEPEFQIYVEDQGGGFDPAELPDPLAEENLLRANGRGIFFMKSFMDEVAYSFPTRGVLESKWSRDSPGRTGRARHTVKERAVAIEAALAGGEVLRRHLGGTLHVSYKGELDLVTEADTASEKAIIALLEKRIPGASVLAEESGADGRDSEDRFIVDPLDGTTNFAHGYPHFAVAIAYEREGVIRIGVVYDPLREELFVAEKGEGAFVNGKTLRVSRTRRLEEALLITGFPYDLRENVTASLRLFHRFVGRARAVRRDGSAALDLCYVAAGRCDGFWEEKLRAWDTAAGSLLVTEAGGRVSDFSGGPFRCDGKRVVATNGLLHPVMLRVLGEAESESLDC